jgi:hypothetical protein
MGYYQHIASSILSFAIRVFHPGSMQIFYFLDNTVNPCCDFLGALPSFTSIYLQIVKISGFLAVRQQKSKKSWKVDLPRYPNLRGHWVVLSVFESQPLHASRGLKKR